jgi:hypothetical protein
MINLLFFLPTLLFCYSLVRIVPVMLSYINTLNVSVLNAAAGYDKLVVVVISPAARREEANDTVGRGDVPSAVFGGTEERYKDGRERVYVFTRKVFRDVRTAVFLNDRETLEKRALGTAEVPLSNEPVVVRNEEGETIATVRIESIKSGSVEVLFYRARQFLPPDRPLLHVLFLLAGWIAVSGSLGGINDYTQRVVFHEPKDFRYLLHAVRKHFARSLLVSLFFSVVIGAVCANIYFYIFIVASDVSVFIAAINVWMLLFFLLVLFWVYPLLVLGSDESVWKIMKKSLFVSFDNFAFTLRGIGIILLMVLFSCFTLLLFPGVSFFFGFVNTALKEVSSRYSRLDVA